MKSFLFLLVSCCLIASIAATAQRPNIIFILTDDMGYGDLSCYGRKEYQTPNLDKLASQGVKFLNAYSAAAVCTPTRASFMTGRYPGRVPVGLFEPLVPEKRDSAYGLTPKTPSIGTRMRKAGYTTALIGKWHLGFAPEHYPLRNGFQYFFGMISGASDYVAHISDGGKADLHEMDSLIQRDGYLTDLLADKAIEFIKRKHRQPFFLTVTFNAPHWPWQGPGDDAYPDSVSFRAGGGPEKYAMMMRSLDDGIGRIIAALDASGMANNTVVIFTNDNGGERYSDNGGLRDRKLTLYEGGIRVPAFVRWPGKIKPATVTKQVATTMDWTATILTAGKARVSKDSIDGIDLMPVMRGQSPEIERTLYWRLAQRAHQKATRSGDWKFVNDGKGEYLFNLATDQAEQHDVKEKYPDLFSTLKSRYEEWESTLLQPIPLTDGKVK